MKESEWTTCLSCSTFKIFPRKTNTIDTCHIRVDQRGREGALCCNEYVLEHTLIALICRFLSHLRKIRFQCFRSSVCVRVCVRVRASVFACVRSRVCLVDRQGEGGGRGGAVRMGGERQRQTDRQTDRYKCRDLNRDI